MDNSLLAVRDINHIYIVVEGSNITDAFRYVIYDGQTARTGIISDATAISVSIAKGNPVSNIEPFGLSGERSNANIPTINISADTKELMDEEFGVGNAVAEAKVAQWEAIMKKDKYWDFVYRDLNLEKEPKEVRSQVRILNFLPSVGIIFGFLLKGPFLILGLLMLAIVFEAIVFVYMTSSNVTALNIVKCRSAVGLSIMLNSSLFAVICLGMVYGMDIRVLFPLLFSAVTTAVYLFLLKKEIEKDKKFRNKRLSQSKATAAGMFGWMLGRNLIRVYNHNIEQEKVRLILAVLLMLYSCLGNLLTKNWLKWYYLKKVLEIERSE